MADIFLSYSRKDYEFFTRMKAQFNASSKLFNIEAFEIFDDSDIPVGNDWKAEIDQKIQNCRAFVFLLL